MPYAALNRTSLPSLRHAGGVANPKAARAKSFGSRVVEVVHRSVRSGAATDPHHAFAVRDLVRAAMERRNPKPFVKPFEGLGFRLTQSRRKSWARGFRPRRANAAVGRISGS